MALPLVPLTSGLQNGATGHIIEVNTTVARYHLGQFEKKVLQNTKQILHSICKPSGKEILYNKSKFFTPKIDFLSKLPLKKTENNKKIRSGPFSSPFDQNWGPKANKF